ncbi:hypothetical protein FOMPIDRAFT_1024907 [Fomitopsis schrenkii]|uniref:Zn(2)-C6 fungal-type domain-containing protein n=1 Tax=Fomitopsis schrenkii TaxID=2126942 RepID=S8FH55_FOMSC|nr:hypothetical protein FOMPIDRAFT_1024907 [Fomitopsis schrenkii]
MADSLHLPHAQYIPQSYYTQPHGPGHMHVVAPPTRHDTMATTQRKRPKYTRSKTGCLTCRAKKIKCDESKPNCLRCTHGQRECTWPEGVPSRKRPTQKRESAADTGLETRPSTAGSSGVSEASTPSNRGITPPLKREPADVGLPAMVSRRHSEPSIQLPTMNDMNAMRRQSVAVPSGPTHGYPVNPSHTQLLPAIPEASAPYSASQYHHHYPSNHQYAHSSSASLVLPRLGPQQGNMHTMRSMAQPNAAQWSPSPVADLDPLGPYFASPQERNLIRHYMHNAISFIMAVPVKNPVANANLLLACGGPATGADVAIEALRAALMGTASVHQSFLCSRGLVQGGADEAMARALSYRDKSNHLLTMACRATESAMTDAALGAAVAICLIDIFSSGRNWSEPLEKAKKLVQCRGGPAVMLARSKKVSQSRLFLEIAAIYELFGCLVTADAPTLLAPNVNNWWLERTSSADSLSYVEEGFGVSREFIPELARVVTFVAHALKARATGDDCKDAAAQDSDIVAEARELYQSIGDWMPSHITDTRVLAGDRIYQNAAQILLLREILDTPPEDEAVQRHADIVINLCLDCGQGNMSVDLNFPVIIAGSQMFGSDRTRVLAVFEIFRTQCCYEIETAEYIVSQVWKRLDDKQLRADWRSVMEDNDLKHLIL